MKKTEREAINNLPSEFRPLSPWSYFGLSILFNVPVVGLIFMIIFACNGSNINRRNFARSYFCVLAIALIAILIAVLVGGGISGILAILQKTQG